MDTGDLNSTMPSILVKDILPYCIPVIKAIPDFTTKSRTSDVFNQKKQKQAEESQYYGIDIQLEYAIDCLVESDRIYKKKSSLPLSSNDINPIE